MTRWCRTTSLFVGREKSVRHGSLCNEKTRLGPISVTTESSRSFFLAGGGVGVTCDVSRRFLRRRCDIQGGEENACDERRMLRLLEMTWRIFGKVGLNVTDKLNSVRLFFDGGFECSTALLSVLDWSTVFIKEADVCLWVWHKGQVQSAVEEHITFTSRKGIFL